MANSSNGMCVVSLLNVQMLGQAKPASAHRGLLVFLSYPNEGLNPNKSFLYDCAGRYAHPKFSSYIHHHSLSRRKPPKCKTATANVTLAAQRR